MPGEWGAVEAQCAAARAYVETYLETAVALDPGMPAEELQSRAREAMEQAVRQYGGVAAEAAAQQYDLAAARLGLEVPPAERPAVEAGGLEEAATAASPVAETVGAYVRRCAARAATRVRRAGADAVISNAMRDQGAGMRYARVPTGRETCGFCLMLASRGFAYRTRESAGWDRRFHDGCDCKVVPGIDGVTRVPGYDPGQYARAWASARDAVDDDGIRAALKGRPAEEVNKAITDEACREVERRAPAWAWRGLAPAVEWARPRDECRPAVADAAEALASCGLVVKTVAGDRQYGDLRMNGRMWAVTDAGGIRKARELWDGKRQRARFVVTGGDPGAVRAALLPGEQAVVVSGGEDGPRVVRVCG